MDVQGTKKKFLKPELKGLLQNESFGKLTFGREVTPKRKSKQMNLFSDYQTPDNKERSVEDSMLENSEDRQLEGKMKKSDETNRLKYQNNRLHEKNMKLLKEMKGLGKDDLNESDLVMLTDKKDVNRSRVTTQRKKRSDNEFEERSGVNKSLKNLYLNSRVSGQEDNYDASENQVSYLLRCIQEREDIIAKLKSRLCQSKAKETELTKSQNMHNKQLEEKDHIIQTLKNKLLRYQSISTPPCKGARARMTPSPRMETPQYFQQFFEPSINPSELMETKKQNYSLKLKINQLTYEVAQCGQQRRQMEAIISELYFDNKFRSQEQQMAAQLKKTCERAKNQFKKLVRQNERSI